MELIAPVSSAIFSYQRSRNDAMQIKGGFASAMTQTNTPAPVSLRPNTPLANIGMLLEILSEAGEPVNGNAKTAAKPARMTRRGDDRRSGSVYREARSQPDLLDTVISY